MTVPPMTGASPLPALTSDRHQPRVARGDAAVTDLAGHARAHLDYLERVGATTVLRAACDAPVLPGDVDLAVVIDLAERRSHRYPIA